MAHFMSAMLALLLLLANSQEASTKVSFFPFMYQSTMSEFFFFNFMHSRLLQLQSIKKNVKKSFERTKKKTGSTHVSYKPDTAGSATSFRHMTLIEMFL